MGFELEKVKKFETPYGARFEWTLLTDQKLVVHLKDKTKIRNRKRWSQVNLKNDVYASRFDSLTVYKT